MLVEHAIVWDIHPGHEIGRDMYPDGWILISVEAERGGNLFLIIGTQRTKKIQKKLYN